MLPMLQQIQVNYHALSAAEKRIADYVMSAPKELANIHIKDLAAKCSVSVATITRFCRKVGAANFVEFKMSVRDSIRTEEEGGELIAEMESIYKAIIGGSRELINQDDIVQAATLLENANRIEIYGIGSSGLSGQEMKFRLMRMGMRVDCHIDSHTMVMNASLLTAADVVLAISNSGHTVDIQEAVALAKENGATVILLTNHEHTPLSEMADLLLLSFSPKPFYARGFLNAQLSIVHVLDLISLVLAQNEERAEARRKTLHALSQLKKI